MLSRLNCISSMLKIASITALVTLFPCNTTSTPLSVSAGPLFEYNFYGQLGIRVSLSYDTIFGGHPQLMLSYTTSRLSFWNGKNALMIDDVLLNAAWHFRPGKRIDPYAGLDVGFIRYDRENDELFALLDNKAARLNIRGGVRASFLDGLLQPCIDFGYALITSSTVFPLFISFGVGYDIMKGIQP